MTCCRGEAGGCFLIELLVVAAGGLGGRCTCATAPEHAASAGTRQLAKMASRHRRRGAGRGEAGCGGDSCGGAGRGEHADVIGTPGLRLTTS